MAILSKIRDRSMFLILIVGLALFAFVLDPSSIQQFFSSSNVNSIGEVNGEEINREDFSKQVEAYKTQSGNKATQMQAVNAVWSSMVSEKIFADQLEKAGIVVGEKDIWDAMTSLPEIQNSPLFRNEANLFDQEKLKEYIANLQSDAAEGNSQAWLNWLETEKSIKLNLERQAYTSLVSAGLGASLEEGERDYKYNNTKMDAEFVFVPYTSIADDLATVSSSEIKEYVSNNPKRFKAEATRSIQFVKFNIEPSESDALAVKTEVASYINDREEYSNAAKSKINVVGLKNATNYEAYLIDNKSDIQISNSYKYKSQLSTDISEAVFNASIGDVVGPYREGQFYKISKVVETLQLPDSVKASHIIIPFVGAVRSNSTKTLEEAKKTADSIYALVKNNKNKFIEVANEINSDGTKGKGGDIGWITKDQAFSQSFDKDFANYIYKNNVGNVGVVKTAFGYHVISIEEQTKAQKAVKLVTFGRVIEASEETENSIFEKAETLAASLATNNKIEEVATENNYTVQNAVNLKALGENVAGLGNQRSIVTWAFKSDVKVGDSKRFDVDVNGNRGYAVVVLNAKTEKDNVALNSEVIAQVRPDLIKKKKAALISEKLKGSTLEEIAKNNSVPVSTASLVSLSSPLLSGVGNEPAVVGAMSTLKINEVSKEIEGEKGVFIVKVTKRDDPVALDNYDTFRKKLVGQLSSRGYQLFQVLEETADINDNRAKFF